MFRLSGTMRALAVLALAFGVACTGHAENSNYSANFQAFVNFATNAYATKGECT